MGKYGRILKVNKLKFDLFYEAVLWIVAISYLVQISVNFA